MFHRACPGRHQAVNSLFLVFSNLCYYFDIKAKDDIPIDAWNSIATFTVSNVSFISKPETQTCIQIKPAPFKCDISHVAIIVPTL